MKKIFLILATIVVFVCSIAQQSPYLSKVWVADLGDGHYQNPIIDADYSDPDVCRVGGDYYMTASSFNSVPGLPILHSKDLVNWKLIGHALPRQNPLEHFSKTQHGCGVWAPAIRYHNNEFFLYYPDPDFGIYLTKAKNAAGPWSTPILLEAGKGLIDPCPFWDEDGKAYLVHAYAGSRAGIKSILVIKQLSADGSKILDEGKIVYDGHVIDPTIEGPKIYKRNGYYYIFAPAGGVSTGWQLVLRSTNVYGPYERYVAMDQGSTAINGPHQGAWVHTSFGEDWFLHFQDKGAYGRVVHLQPMKWLNNWPIIGLDVDGDGKGEPVYTYKKPLSKNISTIETPAESDEFETGTLGLQWQWQANPKATWYFLNQASSKLRLYTQLQPEDTTNYWQLPHLLLQKLPTEEFSATTKLDFYPNPKLQSEKAGIIMMGQNYAYLAVKSTTNGLVLTYSSCMRADKRTPEKEQVLDTLKGNSIYLALKVKKGALCTFSYSMDGTNFKEAPGDFIIEPGIWVGAKMGIFANRISQTNDAGYADFDWFRVGK